MRQKIRKKQRKNNPKKAQKKESSEASPKTNFLLQGTTFFLTYKGVSEVGEKISKQALADYLIRGFPKDVSVKPTKYLICQQTYDSGQPHFHVILIYPTRKRVTNPNYYDYLGIHPNIQTMRNMKAALSYVYKEDPSPLTNINVEDQYRAARARKSTSLYQLLEQQLQKDPIGFDVESYCVKHNLFRQMYKANYSKAFNLIRMAQPAFARKLLSELPGIKLITQEVIHSNLQKDEIEQYYSHPCYQRIIDHINQIHQYPNRGIDTMAPGKTPHLLIVGDSSIGKSALVDHRPNAQHPYPGLMHYYACYHLSIGQKFFPPYRSFDYRMVRWNEFTIISDMFPKSGYNRLLDYLEGAPSALPQKGRAPVQRQDNPKHILTSNRTLQQHICKTFNSQQSRALARQNIGSRIDCVIIPLGKSIHFLRKLFIPNTD